MIEFKIKERREEADDSRVSQIEVNMIIVWLVVLLLILTNVIHYCKIQSLKEKIANMENNKSDISVAEALEQTRVTPNEVNIYIYGSQDTVEVEEEIATYTSLGEFELTAYCSCEQCCGGGANAKTASGATVKPNHTIAADTRILPFGTVVNINGIDYTVEDTGSAVKGHIIDIYMATHEEAKRFGRQKAEVFLKNSQ